MFGAAGSDAGISNVGIVDSYFNGYQFVGGVCGKFSEVTISNCYFDSIIYRGAAVGEENGTVTAVDGQTTDQFAGGEVAYLLNRGKTDDTRVWYQNIDSGTKDSIPVLDSMHGTVYQSAPCPYKYSNSDEEIQHSFQIDLNDDTQHICKNCGLSEKHADVVTFTADPEANSISASCSCRDLGTVTLSADNVSYDGTDKAASTSGSVTGFSLDIVYERKNGEAYTKMDGVPRDAGTYRAGITLGTGAKAATVNVEYTIERTTPMITWDDTSKTVVYTGKAVTTEKLSTPVVTLAKGEPFRGTIAYSYREYGSDAAFTEGLPTETGTYEVKAGIAADGNYTQAEITIKLTITKADAEITLGKADHAKTFGDAAFDLEVTDNNTDADVQYAVTAGSDVVSVDGGTVTILKAGTATITVSLPESTNYNAAATKTITVNVAKKSGYAVSDINKSHYYARDNADTIDLALYLPSDCGAVTYGAPQTGGTVAYTVSPAVADGTLTYTVKQADSAGAAGTIKVTVTTENYADFAITVNAEMVDKIPVSLQNGSSVTLQNSILIYGEALSKLAFNSTVFVDEDGNVVTGTLAWKTPDATPDAGTTSAEWLFTPDAQAYATVDDSVAITVKKATPYIAENPIASAITYGQTLADSTLTGGKAAYKDAGYGNRRFVCMEEWKPEACCL